VEFAGDFVSQVPLYEYAPSGQADARRMSHQVNHLEYGNVNGVYTDFENPARTDGQIDFVVDKSMDKTTQRDDVSLWIRKIRWYGFPRDTNGDGKIDGYPSVEPPNTSPTGPRAVKNNDLQDVVPLRDVFMTYLENEDDPSTIGRNPTLAIKFSTARKKQLMDPIFERDINPYRTQQTDAQYSWINLIPQPPAPTSPLPNDPKAGDYRDSLDVADNNGDGVADAIGARYIAAFGPTDDAIRRIKMIRITVTLDDPNNRLEEGQVYQYVIGLP
jgi:hypothetical protein